MRRALLLLGGLLLLSGCAGTPQSRETGSSAVISVLGAEPGEAGLRLHAAAEGRGEAPPALFHSQGPTLAAAVEGLSAGGDQVANCAHVEHLLLDPGLLPRLPTLLSYAFQDPQQSTESQLWLLRPPEKGDAGTLEELFTPETDPARRMGVLKTAGKDRQGFCPLTLRQAAGALAQGESLLIPALREEEGRLVFAGFALVREGKAAAWLEGQAALGAALLTGQRIHWTAAEAGSSLSLQSLSCRLLPVWRGEALTGLSIRCRLEGLRTGGWAGSDLPRETLEAQCVQSILQGAEQLRRAGGGDLLLARAGLTYPLSWQTLRNQWEEALPRLELRVSVRITEAG